MSGPPVPPPYLEKDAPPPTYQGVPENATGGSDETHFQEKQEKASTHKYDVYIFVPIEKIVFFLCLLEVFNGQIGFRLKEIGAF